MTKMLLAICIAVTLGIALSGGPLFGQPQQVNVGCYAGNNDQYVQVGNLDVVNPSLRAVGLCNAIYNGCYGGCWACWTDSEGNSICKDLSGRLFYR
jgi:hypothetical protein